ncbi:MAG: ATP-binding protein [Bacilli bacterium]|nr:ATP-binding protein [Bacilli bacterium]
MAYRNRVADDILNDKLNSFGGVLIEGPKGCGKTTTAKEHAKSFIEFQDEDLRDNYLLIADTHPSDLLKGEKPRLFDEWQDAPKIWGAVRKSIDDEQKTGLYILTGSSSNNVVTPHTGTLRISRMKMLPMSLYESGDSNGEVSLIDLFNNPNVFPVCESNLTIDDLKFVICRGGWPGSLIPKDKKSQLNIAKDLYKQTYSVDISNIDHITRNPKLTQLILKSYARNICTLATSSTLYEDVKANIDISKQTYYDYIQALEKLYMIEDLEAWSPSIRSKTGIRSGHKRNFMDPSIAVAALGISPEYFDSDYVTLGFLFESLCIRDLKIYSSKYNGTVSYYHDRYDLEADAVLMLEDGRYALIEIKLGQKGIEEGAKHLLEIEKLIKEYNDKKPQHPLRIPDLKIVLTGTQYGHRREDGVFVIPIGCLKD